MVGRFIRSFVAVLFWMPLLLLAPLGAFQWLLQLSPKSFPELYIGVAVICVLIPMVCASVSVMRGDEIDGTALELRLSKFFGGFFSGVWALVKMALVLLIGGFVLFGVIGLLVFGLRQIF